jgi:hypothetical protein
MKKLIVIFALLFTLPLMAGEEKGRVVGDYWIHDPSSEGSHKHRTCKSQCDEICPCEPCDTQVVVDAECRRDHCDDMALPAVEITQDSGWVPASLQPAQQQHRLDFSLSSRIGDGYLAELGWSHERFFPKYSVVLSYADIRDSHSFTTEGHIHGKSWKHSQRSRTHTWDESDSAVFVGVRRCMLGCQP